MAFQREQYATLMARLRERPRTLIFVSGPRQTGKTTLIRQVLADVDIPATYVAVDVADSPPSPNSLLPEGAAAMLDRPLPAAQRDAQWLVQTWQQAREQAAASERGHVLALDEIQKIPNWSETVKGLWDADRMNGLALHVVIAGSAPLLMQQDLTESLAGRFERIRLSHWSFAEMAAAFSFDLRTYLYFGGYPGAAPLIADQRRWREYITGALVEPNIERDVLALRRVDKPALLKQLFDLCAEYSGQLLPYSKMLGQLQDAGNTTTLARYLTLLEQAGLVAGLQKYQGSAHRRRASPPKLNVLNTALMAALSNYTFQDAQADRTFWGRLVESAVGAHLLNTGQGVVRVYYWRESGAEVDFVLQQGPRLLGVEVKSGYSRGTKGMVAFQQAFKQANVMLVGPDGVPIDEFLAAPADHWFEAL